MPVTGWTVLAGLLIAQASPSVTRRAEFYEVRGSTAQELRTEMSRKGPRTDDGVRHDGYTHWYVRWHFEYRSDGRQCVVTSTRTSVDIKVTLPRWSGAAHAPAPLAERWRGFISALERHEDGHAQLGIGAAEAIRQRLLDHPPARDCPTLEAALNAAAEETLGEVRRREREYDARTRHGAADGAEFP